MESARKQSVKSYEEIIDFIAAGSTPADVIAFRPSRELELRVEDLVERSKDAALSPEEQSELDDYLHLEHLIIMAKARARYFIQRAQ